MRVSAFFVIFAHYYIIMKRLLSIAAFALTALIINAQERPFNTRIIPTPQHVVRTEGSLTTNDDWNFDEEYIIEIPNSKDSISVLKTVAKFHKKHPEMPLVIVRQVKDIPNARNMGQAYRLVITRNEFQIYYVDYQGLENASKSMGLLNLMWEGNIPCMEITDYPAYEYRGWLDDISRGPITNKDFMQLQASRLGALKMNFGSYYTEHALYNPQYPDIVPVNSLSEGLASIKEAEGLEMMANLQCFAHFEKTLRIPYYQNMMDTKYNLNPATQISYDFLADQIANTMKHYPESRFFNINCDETESLGAGRARDYVNEIGAADAYCKHINKVYDLLKPYKKDVLMWGDIVGKDPSMLKKLPKDMQYIVWSYVAQDSYNSMLEPFAKLNKEQGTQFWVAPGVSHWSSIPQVRNYIVNIANLARDGHLSGARGLINTAWDDSGESLFGDCWHAMYWSAEMAWNPIKATDPAEAKKETEERERLFNENYERYIVDPEMIYKVGDLASNKWIGDWFNTGALMQPLLEFYPSNIGNDMITRCDSVDLLIGTLKEQLNKEELEHFAYAVHRIQAVSTKSRLRALLYKALNEPSRVNIQIAKDMADYYFKMLHELKKEYLLLWDIECDQYSRDIITDRYDHLGNEVLEAFNHVFISTSADKDGSVLVTMKTIGDKQTIYYTLDGRKPSSGSIIYTEPFKLERSCLVKALTLNEWGDRFESEKYLLKHKGMGHLTSLGSEYSTYKETYSGGGDNALADGELGSETSYADGHWQGYWGNDVIANYNFGKPTSINQISLRFCQNTFDWILAPQEIEVYTSKDGKNWSLIRTEKFEPDFRIGGTRINDNTVRNLRLNTQYLRVVAKNPGKLPEWHPAKGWDSYIFIDEIVIE